MFVKAFDRILGEQYHFNEIRQLVNYNKIYIYELDELINQTNLTAEIESLFQNIKEDNQNMIKNLQAPLEEPCDYANGNETEITNIVKSALDLIHQQIQKLIDPIRNNLLSHITPWENAMLMDKNLEDRIRWYVDLVMIALIVFVVVLGFIPIVLLFLTITCCTCRDKKSAAVSTYRLVFCVKNRELIGDIVVC